MALVFMALVFMALVFLGFLCFYFDIHIDRKEQETQKQLLRLYDSWFSVNFQATFSLFKSNENLFVHKMKIHLDIAILLHMSEIR
jgi:ABC-type antimicrobial peptide transport system permease subunit